MLTEGNHNGRSRATSSHDRSLGLNSESANSGESAVITAGSDTLPTTQTKTPPGEPGGADPLPGDRRARVGRSRDPGRSQSIEMTVTGREHR
jgi:hypothetical protein